LLDECDRATGAGVAVERYGAGDGRFSVRAAGGDEAGKEESLSRRKRRRKEIGVGSAQVCYSWEWLYWQ
jgi:hypothetical protein